MGRRIRARRVACGLSLASLGKHLGISPQQLQHYETGMSAMSVQRLQEIAQALNAPIGLFLEKSMPSAEEIAAEHTNPAGYMLAANAVRLVRAYYQIRDPHLQDALVEIIEKLVRK